MMKLSEALGVNGVDVIHGSPKVSELLQRFGRELAAMSEVQGEALDEVLIADLLMAREYLESTALGDGVAFPHARLTGLETPLLLFAVAPEGVDFEAADGELVYFFIVTLVPENQPGYLLQARAALIHFINAGAHRELLLEVTHRDEIMALVEASEVRVDRVLTARDLMRPFSAVVDPNDTLAVAALKLHRAHSETLPVVDGAGRFHGELSGRNLLNFSLPEYFDHLQKISFLRNVDPLEKYFEVDREATVYDVLHKNDESATVKPEASLIEIVFALRGGASGTLYVVENGQVLGMIDRFSIIDKVLIQN